MPSENVIRAAVTKMDWTQLKQHLDGEVLDAEASEDLLEILMRCPEFIFKRPDQSKAQVAKTFRDQLVQYLAQRIDPKVAAAAETRMGLFDLASDGYEGILSLLAEHDKSGSTPDQKLAAVLSYAVAEIDKILDRQHKQLDKSQERVFPQATIQIDEDGNPFNVDQAVETLGGSLISNIFMQSYQNGWFNQKGEVVLPIPANTLAGRSATADAKAALMLAILWSKWERCEERARYFDLMPELHELQKAGNADPVFKKLPEDTEIAIDFARQLSWDMQVFVANERLNDKLFRVYLDILNQTNVKAKLGDFAKGVAVAPAGLVTESEVHSLIGLSEILSFAVVSDQTEYAGLRLTEWVRGYAVLHRISEIHYTPGHPKSAPLMAIERKELVAHLTRNGLSTQKAERFLDRATLKRISRDLYDTPLALCQDGSYLLFNIFFHAVNITRVVLSAMSSARAEIKRKGKAFEADILAFLTGQGLTAKAFTERRNGDEYEYDVVAEWGDYVFLFECKSRSLPNDPISSYYFMLEAADQLEQVQRLASALHDHPDILVKHFGPQVAGKKVIPCILNSLPFCIPGGLDDVLYVDSSSLKRFFEASHFRLHRTTKGANATLMHKHGVRPIWAGSKPTAEDFLKYLTEPPQFDFVFGQVREVSAWFQFAKNKVARGAQFTRQGESLDEMVRRLGGKPEVVRKEMDAVADAVRKGASKAKP